MNMVHANHLLETYIRQLQIDPDSAVEIPLSLRLVDAPMGDEPVVHIDEALAEGKAEVRELEPPTVSRLEVHNHSDVRVLVPPFALLQGGGQNRTVVKPAVLEPHSVAIIEVHCVQMGRWNPRPGGTFARSSSAPMAFKRRSMKDYYSEDRRVRGPAYDQGETWARVADSLHASGRHSVTSDLMEEVASYRPIEVPDKRDASGLLSQVAAEGWALESSSKSTAAPAVRRALAASLGSLRAARDASPAGSDLDERFRKTRDMLLEHGRWEIHPVTGGWHAVLTTDPRLPNLFGQAVVDETGVLWLSLQDAPELPEDEPRRARRRRPTQDRHRMIERVEAIVREVRSLLSERVLEEYAESRHIRDVIRYFRDRRSRWEAVDGEHAGPVSPHHVRRIAFDLVRRRMRDRSRAE